MCGLSGEIRFDGGQPDLEGLDRISAVMEPRGPDGHGRWHHGPVALAHRRLKIIDLTEAGAQPMVDDELDLVTVFNGCIYNYGSCARSWPPTATASSPPPTPRSSPRPTTGGAWSASTTSWACSRSPCSNAGPAG